MTGVASPLVAHPRPAAARAWALLGLLVSALFFYKWTAALRTLTAVRVHGKLTASPAVLLDGGPLATSAAYFGKIAPALVYGILLGAALHAAIPERAVARWLGGRGPRPTLAGALAGVPLMLCSCCITPVFTGLHQRGARLGPSLAVMLASPGLNVAALALTFALLPARVGLLRTAAALVIVLGASAAIGADGERERRPSPVADSAAPAAPEGARDDAAWPAFFRRFAKSILLMVALTVPLLAAGVVASGFVLPHVTQLARTTTVSSVAAVAFVGMIAALPTFFEIPIALLLSSLGAPPSMIVAFVIAGPIVNLPSLLVFGREAGPRAALALGAGVWAVATGAGLLAMI